MTDLSAKSIGFAYRNGVPVLDGVNLEVARGEVLALCGGNGSGKTTLLKIMAGQLRPQTGAVMCDGLPLAQMSPNDIAARITLMPQNEHRDVPMTVRQIVSLGRAGVRGWWLPLTRRDHEQVRWAMSAVDIDPLADRPITELSGGQWRRAVLARSLAQEAEVMLLDEPTAGLDLKHQHESLALVQQLVRRRGLAVLMPVHDLNLAAMYADRIAMIIDRRIAHVGGVAEVLIPENIQDVYGIDVAVVKHPTRDVPVVIAGNRHRGDAYRDDLDDRDLPSRADTSIRRWGSTS